MTNLVPVNRGQLGDRRWIGPTNYSFFARESIVAVVSGELDRAVATMPLAFVQVGGKFTLAAMLSPASGGNMFVAPDGTWLSSYVPAVFRSYPFCLLATNGANEQILGIDMDSGLITHGGEGERFFEEDGKPSPKVLAVLNMLGELERHRTATQLAVSSLAAAELIKPWPFTVGTQTGPKSVEGFYRFDETSLNALPDDVFLKLRSIGALRIGYAQLFSMGQLSVFEQLGKVHSQFAAPPPVSLDPVFGFAEGETLKFDS